jgi:hypothetical protein
VGTLPNGHTQREVVLTNVYVPSAGARGAVLSIHPTSTALQMRVAQIPPGGNLLACPVDPTMPTSTATQGWGRTTQPCIVVGSADTTEARLTEADGNTHVAIELDGTWPTGMTIDEIHLGYEAVDDHFSIEFATS